MALGRTKKSMPSNRTLREIDMSIIIDMVNNPMNFSRDAKLKVHHVDICAGFQNLRFVSTSKVKFMRMLNIFVLQIRGDLRKTAKKGMETIKNHAEGEETLKKNHKIPEYTKKVNNKTY